MLYIWPYIVFFSFPIIFPTLFNSACNAILDVSDRSKEYGRAAKGRFCNPPQLCLIIIATLLSAVAVRYNTIIHPFTLADNRHYVFYTFRLLRLHPAIMYAVIPIYLICAWMAINSIGGLRSNGERVVAKGAISAQGSKQKADRDSSRGRVSFVLTWTAVSALSVITAPLVEPRYFIIPWLLWRLHVPLTRTHSESGRPRNQQGKRVLPGLYGLRNFALYSHRGRLWLETGWFTVVNVLTGYVFLHRGFLWPQEPGRVQRFMW